MKLIVGLGNPGFKYAKTRHNLGFWVIDQLSDIWEIPLQKERWKAEIGEGFVQGEKVILMKPQTYMNLSGEAVLPAVEWLKLNIDEVCVVCDDVDLPVGQIRLRMKGSSGGNNGLKSIIHHLGTDQFKRIKLGIGRPTGRISVPDYVLGMFPPEEMDDVYDAVDRSCEALKVWLGSSFNMAMNQYNKKG
ncbi:aminoacyl-tRNA hydrolase [Hazenella sp. IB182357]|uniref:Peptidyl-tRNA hydrolase n=1 Tax=Polycladospora coralii TaxID=2771432 RepID=A0A926RU41_9BACL|nr:aminoacyl-tRNA hydrolase [Polycladospora coralii]MBS7531785.1 aminoacyl-tRNA hydrolase [Polycladospora coralii]